MEKYKNVYYELSNYQRGKKKGGDILLTPTHYACPKPGPGFPMPYFMILFFVLMEVRGGCTFC
jgi:hypothetical protein